MKIDTFKDGKILIADKGKYLTEYKDGDNILKYVSYSVMYIPETASIEDIREITKEENARLTKALEEKLGLK